MEQVDDDLRALPDMRDSLNKYCEAMNILISESGAERTVRYHLTSIFNKLGADNRTQAVALLGEEVGVGLGIYQGAYFLGGANGPALIGAFVAAAGRPVRRP